MKKLDLGQTITILANIGVIAGIMFLGLELQQNNALLEAEARRAVLDRRTSVHELLAANEQLANVMAKSADGEPLTAGETIQVDAYNRRLLSSFEWQFGEYQRGTLNLSEESLGGWRMAYHRVDRHQLRETWMVWLTQAPPEFVEFFEENVINRPFD